MTIKVTNKAKAILEELVILTDLMEAQTAVLADRDTSNSLAMDTGAARERTRGAIVGTAYRLVYECTGRTPATEKPRRRPAARRLGIEPKALIDVLVDREEQ